MCDSINRGNYPEESLLVGAEESVWKGSDARVNISIDVGQRLADTIGEEIEDEGTPMGAFDEPHCWVHWVMLLGIEDEAPEAVPATGRQAL